MVSRRKGIPYGLRPLALAAALFLACAGDEPSATLHFDAVAPDLDGVVAYYPFYGNANDGTGLGHDGEVVGAGFGTDRFGSPASALSLDGIDDHVLLGHHLVADSQADFSISLWFRSTSPARSTLYFEAAVDGPGVWVRIHPDKDLIIAHLEGAFHVKGQGAFQDGHWHHLVLRARAGEGAEVFVDSVVTGATEEGATWTLDEGTPQATVLGRMGEADHPEPFDHYEGMLDDVVVVRRALDDEEIAALLGEGPNRVPVAQSGRHQSVFVHEVTVDGSASWDDDGVVVAWSWDFGDGSPAQVTAQATHRYEAPGVYDVTLTVTDDGGGQDTESIVISIRDASCPTTDCGQVDPWPDSWKAFELAMLDAVNGNRGAGAICGGEPMEAAPPLEMNEIIRVAARLHSLDMATQDYFSHEGLDGRGAHDRMTDAGFVGPGPWGENIAAGSETAQEAVAGFMQSPGHCMNIMEPEYKVIGLGYAYDPTSSFGHYGTQTFAAGH